MVIMLNLLISVVSDTYDKVQLDVVAIDYRQKCSMLLELYILQNIYCCGKNKKSGKYLRYLQLFQMDAEDGMAVNEWEGRLNSAKKDQRKIKNELKNELIEHIDFRLDQLKSLIIEMKTNE